MTSRSLSSDPSDAEFFAQSREPFDIPSESDCDSAGESIPSMGERGEREEREERVFGFDMHGDGDSDEDSDEDQDENGDGDGDENEGKVDIEDTIDTDPIDNNQNEYDDEYQNENENKNENAADEEEAIEVEVPPITTPNPTRPSTPNPNPNPGLNHTRSSTPTTDELVQYARDTRLFAEKDHAENVDKPDDASPSPTPTPTPTNHEVENLSRLRAAITRSKNAIPIPIPNPNPNPNPNPGLNHTRSSTPTTDELVQYARDTRLFAEKDYAEKLDDATPIQTSTPISTSTNHEVKNLSRLRAAITRSKNAIPIPIPIPIPNPIFNFSPLNRNMPMPCGMKVRDFGASATAGGAVVDGAPFAGMRGGIEDLSGGVGGGGGGAVVDEGGLRLLGSLRDRGNESPLARMPETPIITAVSTPNLSDLADYANEMNIFDEKSEWATSPEATREIFQPRGNGEGKNAAILVPPAAPGLKNLSAPGLSVAKVLFDDAGDTFQSLPLRLKKSYARKDVVERPFIIGVGSATSSADSIIPAFATPPGALSEQGAPRLFHPRPISMVVTPTYTPHDTPPQAEQKFNMWDEITRALGIPAHASHPLTADVLAELSVDYVSAHDSYTEDDLEKWALFQNRILKWINSGALEDGIDGVVDGRPFIVSLPSFLSSNESHAWSYESLETFWRNEPGMFRRTIDWIQDAEGSVGSIHTLHSSVYDFFQDEEEIIHRSASESALDSLPEKVYKDEGNAIDQSYQLVTDLFRSRELRRLEMDQSPIISHVNPNLFKLNHEPGEYERAKALSLTERVAVRVARRHGEDLRGEAVPVVATDTSPTPKDSPAWFDGPIMATDSPAAIGNIMKCLYGPNTLAAFRRQQPMGRQNLLPRPKPSPIKIPQLSNYRIPEVHTRITRNFIEEIAEVPPHIKNLIEEIPE
ncbi:hypothetical protein NHQ30_001400 [Ciborinia camelliae]|nr:hypothetical protein NHQ30_001400 [Ciborinia camelliae]